jgi:hypothetical protein
MRAIEQDYKHAEEDKGFSLLSKGSVYVLSPHEMKTLRLCRENRNDLTLAFLLPGKMSKISDMNFVGTFDEFVWNRYFRKRFFFLATVF